MITSPKQGKIVYFKNLGRRTAAPVLCGKIRIGKPYGDLWEVDAEDGRRVLLYDHEMFGSKEEAMHACIDCL